MKFKMKLEIQGLKSKVECKGVVDMTGAVSTHLKAGLNTWWKLFALLSTWWKC